MSNVNKVIWTEGMFLRPQHFQQHDRYLEQQLTARSLHTDHYFWGFSQLQVDRNALAQGRVGVVAAKGVFKDGTLFEVGQHQPIAALAVPEGVRNELVGFALPTRQASAQQVSFAAGEDALARYMATEAQVVDSSDVSLGTVDIQLGELNLSLMRQSEVEASHEFLPFARIKGRDNDSVVLDPHYIPPTLNLSEISGPLQDMVSTAVTLLDSQSKRLADRLSVPAAHTGFSALHETMMLSVMNRYHAYFHHVMSSNFHHPEQLFCQLQMLLNEMAVFLKSQRRLEGFVQYDHDDLQASFAPLMARLSGALNVVLEDPYVVIELEDKGQGLRVGQVKDRNLLGSADFILGVQADMPSEALRKHFPSQVKFGPVDRIRDLVHLQLPGVMLKSIDQVPPQLPYHPGYVYFALEQRGDLWQQFLNKGALAMHLAGEFPGLELEFWAVRQQHKRVNDV